MSKGFQPPYYVIAESAHEIQNPTSEEKIVLLGERVGLKRGSRVLDIAAGRGGPALILSRAFECTIECIEREPAFYEAAIERATADELSHLVSFRLADASKPEESPLPERYDAALCLGASFVYGGLEETITALTPAVRPGGYVAVGEPYWRQLPAPEDDEDGNEPYKTLLATVGLIESLGLPIVSVIASSEDDWDRYETLHWRSVEHWLADPVEDRDAILVRRQHEREKERYLAVMRELLGWAIFVGWKRP